MLNYPTSAAFQEGLSVWCPWGWAQSSLHQGQLSGWVLSFGGLGSREDCRPRGRRRPPGGCTAERSQLGPMSGGLMWPAASLLRGDGRACLGFGQGSQSLLFQLESGGLGPSSVASHLCDLGWNQPSVWASLLSRSLPHHHQSPPALTTPPCSASSGLVGIGWKL